MFHKLKKNHLISILSVASFLTAWKLLTVFNITDKIFISTPGEVLLAGSKLLSTGIFYEYLAISIEALLTGLILATILGITIGMLCVNKSFYAFIKPHIYMLNAVPIAALIPLLLIWFGIGIFSKIVIIFLISFIPIVINTINGINHIEKKWLRLNKSFDGGNFKLIHSIGFYNALPYIFSGLKIAVGRSMLGLTIAEVYGYGKGLGYLISFYGSTMQTANLIFIIFILVSLNFLMLKLIAIIEKNVIVWK